MTKKAVQDSAEDNNKKRKKEEKEKEINGRNKNKNKRAMTDNMWCPKHKTHSWSECSKNPKSKNYYHNPKSPFFVLDEVLATGVEATGTIPGEEAVEIWKSRRRPRLLLRWRNSW